MTSSGGDLDNPLRFVKNTHNEEINPPQKTGEYEMEIYFGGKQGDKLYFGKPVIYDTDKEGKYMYPNEARLRNMTYAMSIHFDIEIDVKVNTGNFINNTYCFLICNFYRCKIFFYFTNFFFF